MDNVSGKANWFQEEKIEQKTENKEKKVRNKRGKKEVPDFSSALGKILKDTENFYSKNPSKKMGDFLIQLNSAYFLSRNLD